MSKADYARQYYLEHKEHIRAMEKRRYLENPKFCPVCGTIISREAKHCPKHAISKTRWQKGNKHPSWKGGRIIDSGYIFIYQPDHPRANKGGYVAEHILVWEQAHGKPLPKGWIIHHLNGIKADNRPINLIAFSVRKHSLVLQAKAKRIQELEALLNNQRQLI